ncbi:MAG TPA: aldehyde dehydrogenase family protein, partial [Solirubrobacteraceae bacterium]|nr:aldehyde dehydrogenase family protein [Solirubrobacteraceae bacterium]
MSVIEPATETVLATVDRAGADEVDEAVARAREAFPGWRALDPGARARLLYRLASAIEAELEPLAVLEARNA